MGGRFWRRAALALVAAGAVAFSAGGPAARPAAERVARAAPAGEVQFWLFGDPEEQKVFQAVVDAYQQQNPAVSVKISATGNQGDYMTKLSTSFAGGAAPDVFLINYRRYGQFAGKGLVEPAEDWLARSPIIHKEDFFPTALGAFTTDGKVQCIPQNQSSLVVYYNRDLFEKAGVPLPRAGWTWDEFVGTAQRLTLDTDGDGKIDVYGLGVEPQIVRSSAFIWQHGGRIVDQEAAPKAITFDDAKTREAMRFFVELSTVHGVIPSQAEVKAEDLDTRFMTGRLAMRLESRRAVPDYRTIEGFTWDVAALPVDAQAATPLHSDAYCMSAASKNKDAAWDFVSWANGPDGQAIASRLGRTVPSLKAVADSAAFLDPSRLPANSRVFLDVAPAIRVLPVMPQWPAIERVLNEEIERAFYGADFEEAMNTAQQKATAELAK